MDSGKLNRLRMEEDFISRLPDDVLSNILSRLETIDAVKTSILSSRWKYLWTLIHNLCFMMDSFEDERLFFDFVEHVIRHCKSDNIQEFHLETDEYIQYRYAARIEDLISKVVERNVHTLTLIVDFDVERPMIRLPQRLLTCENLVRLTLCSWDPVVDIPESSVCFPSLKFLSISLTSPDPSLPQKLFSQCPVLEELIIDEYDNNFMEGDLEELSFEITVPTLMKLKLNVVRMHTYDIRASNIKCLSVGYYFPTWIEMEEALYNLDELSLGCRNCVDCSMFSNDIEAKRAKGFLKAIRSTRHLLLASCILDGWIPALVDDKILFSNLISLNLDIKTLDSLPLVLQLLNYSPLLEILILDDIGYWLNNALDEIDDFQLEPPDGVPSCMLFHLKKIHVSCMKAAGAVLKLFKYLLENCKVLERFSVRILGDTEEEEARRSENEILNLPRAPRICEFEVEFPESAESELSESAESELSW